MHLEVFRYLSNANATLSRVYLVDGARKTLLCHGLEDEYRETKIAGETRIPAGQYRVTMRKEGGFHNRYAPRFAWHIGMIWVRDVPGFKWILWHIGNFETNTDGCLLLGRADTKAMAVWSSGTTYARVYQLIAPMIADGRITHVAYIDGDR